MRKEYLVPIILVIIVIPLLLFFRKNIPNNREFQNSVDTSPTISGEIRSTTPLLETTWQWNETRNADGTVTTPSDASKFRMVLKDTHMTSTTDCNTVNADFLVDHEVLSFGPIVSTKMYCEGSLESAYTQSFPLVTSYTIENDVLTLILIKDMGTMLFTAID